MKATHNGQHGQINRSHRKERAAGYNGSLLVVGNKKGQVCETIAEARFYWSSSFETCYCCLWVHGDNYTAGSGKAGGYGYHKESAALAEAIKAAGIKLDRDISGRGSEAMREAMEAIGRIFHTGRVQTIKTHP